MTARPRRAGGSTGKSHYKTRQRCDVGSDDRVVYGMGSEYDFGWAQIGALNNNHIKTVVENWPCHWTASGEQRHVAASSLSEPVLRSGIVLKVGRGGSLRSHLQADYDVLLPAGNGRIDRRGRQPDEFFYAGPCTDNGRTCAVGPGGTGYRESNKPTQRLGGVVFDRRTHRMYFGYCTQSVLPGGNPDFEPAVVGMDADSTLLWWSRLYEQTGVSEPDAYIGGLAFDHSSNSVVVLARSHGNNTITFWNGNEIGARPEAQGFQNRFTGTSGNIHISGLGRFGATDGTLQAATWLAELSEGLSGGVSTFADVLELLQGQLIPNAGSPDLNTIRCRSDVFIASDGRVGVVCTGGARSRRCRRTRVCRNLALARGISLCVCTALIFPRWSTLRCVPATGTRWTAPVVATPGCAWPRLWMKVCLHWVGIRSMRSTDHRPECQCRRRLLDRFELRPRHRTA